MLKYNEAKKNKIFLKKKSKQIRPENILRLEAEANYTYIYTKSGKFIFAKTLKSFETSLDASQFIRAHRSHLINKTHVKSASSKGDGLVLKLESGIEIDVSRRRQRKVRKFFAT